MSLPHTSSSYTGRCLIPDCTNIANLHINRPAAEEGIAEVCTHHYFRICHMAKSQGLDEDAIWAMSNQQLIALASGDEFRQVMAKLVDDAKFKRIVKRAAKRGRCTND